ncbi:alpha/beta hydrolase [Pseudonocardia xishanensis]|uniref:alpha/beta fold hydrolase n=1 Tax=Pseudonocardia xishanensis TaxID=630995 RepID=UPI0031EA7CA6
MAAQEAETIVATYVLVHGGGHGGWCWGRVARLLRAAGHEVFTPTLTGLGERSHLVSAATNLDTHIDDVVNVLQYEDITDAILVGHSYAGMVITGVADRALARVGHLVFLEACRPRNGESLYDTGPDVIDWARSSGRTVDGVELVLWPSEGVVEAFGIRAPEDAAWALERLTPHPWKTMEQALRMVNEDAVRRIPFTNINAPGMVMDGRTPESRRRALEGDRVWEIDAGHDLMLTAPKETAELLLRLV